MDEESRRGRENQARGGKLPLRESQREAGGIDANHLDRGIDCGCVLVLAYAAQDVLYTGTGRECWSWHIAVICMLTGIFGSYGLGLRNGRLGS